MQKKLYLCADLILAQMKKHFSVGLMLLVACVAFAQTHIQISDDPNSWSASSALYPYIGETVIFDSPIVVSSNASSTLTVGPWRVFVPECQGLPGSVQYNTTVRINSACTFSLSGVSGYHRCGEKIYNLKAKVDSSTSVTFVDGEWRGNKRADLEAGLPDLGDYRLLVCGFNLENYFVEHLGKSYLGANSYAEHQDQRAKISTALKKINADIFGLVELEQGNKAIEEIVNDLNSNLPERNYKYFKDATPGSSQKVDYVYDANVVEPIGTPVENNTELHYRKKMLCFRERATGEKFIYSINHFKSMNTGGADRRLNEAKSVVDEYYKYRNNRNVRDNDILIMGDLNCYAMTAPILYFTNQSFMDLHRAFHADSSYSYMFGGQASYIDHAISSESLYRQVTGMAAYTINSDEDDDYNYQKSSDLSMFRCSDHDPVLVGLKLDSTLSLSFEPYINTADILKGGDNKMVIQNAFVTNETSYYAIYRITGQLIKQGEIASSVHEVTLPEEPGVYIVYIYHKGQTYKRKLIVR